MPSQLLRMSRQIFTSYSALRCSDTTHAVIRPARRLRSQSTLSQTSLQSTTWRDVISRWTGPPPPRRPRNPLNWVELESNRRWSNRYHMRRMLIAGMGLACCSGSLWVLQKTLQEKLSASSDVEHMDALPGSNPNNLEGKTGKEGEVVATKPGQPEIKLDAYGNELIDTGTSTIPHFPKHISLPTTSSELHPSPAPGEDEAYTLLGLGIRTVSFLSIQVYVLGFYVRTTDLARLQAAFVKHINPIGSSLIPGEKADLRRQLLDADTSADLWDKVLREAGLRSAVRIVPTRNTDFGHLRDGWVRGITNRTQEASRKGDGAAFDDEAFGESMKQFKALFGGRGSAPKGSEVLLTRDENGKMSVAYGEKEGKPSQGEMKGKQQMGRVADERISRLVWLGYLGGKNVSSEGARKNIVDGVMELVERPVGTVGVAIS